MQMNKFIKLPMFMLMAIFIGVILVSNTIQILVNMNAKMCLKSR